MTPEQRTEAFEIVTDDILVKAILGASVRLVVVAPALTKALADAICQRW